MKIRYECEQCGTIYTSEAAALRCEAQDTKYLSGFSNKNVQLHFWLRRLLSSNPIHGIASGYLPHPEAILILIN